MTVSSETLARVQYNGNGSTTVFSVPFVFSTSADLEVYITVVSTGVETLKTLTTHYIVTGGGGTSAPATGSITFGTAPASGERVTILRSLANKQTVDYVENDAFPAQSHELALDRLTLQVQDLKENLSRAIVFTAGSTPTDISVGSPVAGSVLVWDDTATVIETVSLDTVAAPVALSSVGLMACTSLTPRTYAGRTLTGTANQITITNGDGVSGNPTISLPSSIIASGSLESTTTTTVGTNLIVKGANELRLNNSGDTYYTGFKAPALSANRVYTLPTGDGTSGQVLSTNGSGTLSWATASGGSSDMVKISTTTVSGSPTTIDFTGLDTTTYKAFYFIFDPLVAISTWTSGTISSRISVQLYQSGVLNTSGVYFLDTAAVTVTSGTSYIQLGQSQTRTNAGSCYSSISGQVMLANLNSTAFVPSFNDYGTIIGTTWDVATGSSNTQLVSTIAGGMRTTGGVIDGIRFTALQTSAGVASAVNFINDSRITLYGIK